MFEMEWFVEWRSWLSQTEFYGHSLTVWLSAAGVFLLAIFMGYLLKWIALHRAAKFAERTESYWDDLLLATFRRTRWWFMLLLAAFLASLVLDLPDKTRTVIERIAILTLLLQAAFWGNVLIGAWVERYVKRRMDDDPASVTMISMLALLCKLFLFSILLLLALDNLGIDVTALITGLGIGGIAVALAVQNILGDLLASLSIVFDKPFVLGDFIIVGDQLGTVEKIGVKTTRIRSLSGEQLVFSNNDLLSSRIRNFKRMAERRVVFGLGVTYDTPRKKLEQIPPLIEEIVQSQENIRFDRAHFKAYGDFSLNFEIVYYVLSPDYTQYMDIQQAINLAIYDRFEELGVEFAFPTQTLHLERAAAD